MTLTLRPLFVVACVAFAGCAAQNKASAPMDYYDAGAAAQAPGERDAFMAEPGTAEAGPEMPALPSTAGAAMPAGAVLGSVAATPTPAPDGGGAQTKADDAEIDLSTMGADSVDQLIIFTGQLAMEVDFEGTGAAIDDAVAIAVGSGGYVAEMTDQTLRVRVPSKNFRRAMKQLEALGEVRSRGVQAVDVSEEFHDLEVRLENLRATRKRIEKLLASSGNLSEILTVEKELERVTVEIDRLEGRLRLLSSQAAFSTIAMAFTERPVEQEVHLIADDDHPPPPPPPPPRTLASSAPWVSQIGIESILPR